MRLQAILSRFAFFSKQTSIFSNETFTFRIHFVDGIETLEPKISFSIERFII